MKRSKLPLHRFQRCLLLFAVIVGCTTVSPAHAQVYRAGWGWGRFYGPADAISNRIRAQAELERSLAESEVNHAQAREIRADAIRKEIANSVEYAKAYWEKKEIYRAAKLRTYTAPLDAADLRNSLTWRRLNDHPEMKDGGIVNGKMLNFLLHELAGEAIVMQYSPGAADPSLNDRLILSPEILSKLRLREAVPGGKGLVFPANSREALNIQRWPFGLQGDQFVRQRNDFDEARAALAAAPSTDNAAINACMKTLLHAHDQLDRAFYKYYTKERRTEAGGKYYDQYLTSRRFLESLAGELMRLQELGGGTTLDDSTRFDGNNLIALITHMARNGLEFAPSQPGGEAAYNQTFKVMRDLYIKATEDNADAK